MIEKIGIYRDPRNKNKPWVVRWFGDYNPATGKQRRYSKSFRLKVEAEKFQADQRETFHKGATRCSRKNKAGRFLQLISKGTKSGPA
jgi:hypothetical protein